MLLLGIIPNQNMAIFDQQLVVIGSWWIIEQGAIPGWRHSLTADQHFSIQM